MLKKFSFGKDDNIYKIFQVIDKLPKSYKEVVFDIDNKNEFFSNKWWLKLVLEKIKDKGIKVKFLIENQKQEIFIKSLGAEYIWRKVPFYKKVQKNILEFLEIFKSEYGFYQKHYNLIKIFLLVFEIGIVFFAIYFIYNLVTPKTDVYIQPAVNIKHLVKKIYTYPEGSKNYKINNKEFILYKKEIFDKVYTLKLPVKDIQYIAKPSYGTVIFYNTTTEGLSLKSNTILKTKDGLLFRLTNWIYVPPKDGNGNPGTAKVKLKAENLDQDGNIIGERGNIIEGTKLYIKKIYLSYGQKRIYAEVLNDFSGGETKAKGEVNLQDIELVKKQLLIKFKKNLKSNIYKYIQLDGNKKIVLMKNKLYGFDNISYKIYANPGDKLSYIQGDIQGTIYFNYIDKDDVTKVFTKYLKDRLVSESDFLGYDENSIEITQFDNISKGLYMITLSINALLGYDFDDDYNHIIPKIVGQIKGKSLKIAKNIILDYSEIMGVELKTTNKLKTVPNLKSRIYIHIVK